MSNLLSQASLVMIPSGYKEDVVYSQIPSDGSGDLSFTRASNGTRINSAGLVEVCPWNFIQYSNAFSTSPWVNPRATLTSGQTDPNGGSNAWKVELAGGGTAYLGQFGVGQIGVVTISAYFRADSSTTIGFNDGSSFSNSITIGTTWQRYEFSYAVTSGQCNMQIDNYFGVSPSGQAKTFYIYGAQLNIGSIAKPYFPTTDRLNVPRLTYQNGGGGCPSLLLEKQSTNIVTYSEEFDNAAWGKYQCSISANQTTSPDGTQNADKLTLAVGSGTYTGLVYRLTTPGANSIFMKNDSIGNGKFYIQVDGIGNARWNSDGTLVSVSGGTATNGENMGNGWFRFTYVCSGGAYINYGIENGTTGDSIFIWGAQVEASSYPTSYIPTTSSSATRVADACYKTGISSLIGQTEGVVFLDSYFDEADKINLSVSDGTSSNFIQIETTSGAAVVANINSGGVSQASMSTSSSFFTSGQRLKIAIAYKANDFALYINGVQIATDSSGSAPSTDQLICARYNGALAASQRINELILFKTRLTNAELASLTTI